MLIMVHPKFICKNFDSKAVMGDISLSFKNNYDKTIKYIYFSIVLFNQFKEPVESSDQVHKLKYIGPLNINEIANSVWKNLYFYHETSYYKENPKYYPLIFKIKVVFIDNTTDEIMIPDIKYDDSILSNEKKKHYIAENDSSKLPKAKEGCYIATCVYGSYDCPEVWTLRRFRDFYLKKKSWGKKIIKMYYKISPNLVAIFGKNTLFKKPCKAILNTFVAHLQKKGYQNSKYKD